MNHTKEEGELVNRFKVAYNHIHDYMHDTLKKKHKPFGTLLDTMLERHLIKRKDYTFLDDCRELRNFIVHSKNLYMAIPSIHLVENIERLANKFANAPTVSREFSRQVEIIRASDTMYHVMSIIDKTGYTLFPVYDDENNFVNLLTESVLALWLAKYVAHQQEMNITEPGYTVADALNLHDDGEHWEFISRHMTVSAATAMFAEKPILEALLITERGKTSETPIGIVTRSDALDMLDGKRDV